MSSWSSRNAKWNRWVADRLLHLQVTFFFFLCHFTSTDSNTFSGHIPETLRHFFQATFQISGMGVALFPVKDSEAPALSWPNYYASSQRKTPALLPWLFSVHRGILGQPSICTVLGTCVVWKWAAWPHDEPIFSRSFSFKCVYNSSA